MKSVRHLTFDATLNEERKMLEELVIPCLQERFNACFSSIKGRMKFIKRLDHQDFFNPLYKNAIRSDDDTINSILEILERKKATKDCYVMSTNSNIVRQD